MQAEYSMMYPWQPEIAGGKAWKEFNKVSRYSEWPCAFVCPHGYHCPCLLNDINLKNKKRIYCDFHRNLVQKRNARRGYLRWEAKQNELKAGIKHTKECQARCKR